MKTAKEISKMLADRAQDVAKHLFPQGKREGQEWCVGDLTGEPGKSLKIHLQGAKAGLWSDFAAGKGGDLLDLWSLSHRISLGATIKEASSYLGISLPQFENSKPKDFNLPKKQIINSIEPTSAVMQYLTQERKLFSMIVNKFHISQEKNMIVFPYIRDGKIVFVKYLSLTRDADGKKIISATANCEPCLFGWHTIPENARRIAICEGEIDAMTLRQYGIPALSVPFGGLSMSLSVWLSSMRFFYAWMMMLKVKRPRLK
jgi:twinkle protein